MVVGVEVVVAVVLVVEIVAEETFGKVVIEHYCSIRTVEVQRPSASSTNR